MTISRRNFGRLAVTSGAAAVASPAIAQGAIKWRLASSFPKSLEGLWGASPTLAKYVNEMSDGKFTIQPFAAGEIVPGLQVLDAVANGTVECGHSYASRAQYRDPFAIRPGDKIAEYGLAALIVGGAAAAAAKSGAADATLSLVGAILNISCVKSNL